jgi:membrane fusion protein, multidrug efflux system
MGIIALLFLTAFIKDHLSCARGVPEWKKSKTEVVQKTVEELPPQVKVYKVAKVSFRDTLPSLGTIKGFREIDLKFSTPGVIEYINFKEGEKITQGDIIASLDQKEQLLKLEYAKLELDKQTKFMDLGYIVETKFKQSQLEYQSAKAELDKTNLVALSDGYIGSLEVDRGSYVSPQDKIGTFVDVKDVYVEFGIIEKDIAKIREGQNVEVSVESFGDQIFKGQVESISPIVEGRSRTVEVKSKIANIDEKIKPGMFGRVNVLVYEKEDALIIPSSSFKKKDDQYFVYLVHEDSGEEAAPKAQTAPKNKGKGFGGFFGKKKAPVQQAEPEEPQSSYGIIEMRPIEIAYATPDAIEIKEGLDEGDLIITDLEQELQDKARVEITETQEGIF